MANDRYRLINYFDVWGNQEEGWEVNNLCEEEGEIILDENARYNEMVQALIDFGFFKPTVTELDVDIRDDHYMIEFRAKNNNMPICRLELIEN